MTRSEAPGQFDFFANPRPESNESNEYVAECLRFGLGMEIVSLKSPNSLRLFQSGVMSCLSIPYGFIAIGQYPNAV